jgi:hypothetical protein
LDIGSLQQTSRIRTTVRLREAQCSVACIEEPKKGAEDKLVNEAVRRDEV